MFDVIKPYAYKINLYAGNAVRKVWDKAPSLTVNNKSVLKNIRWIGEHISSPENRLILGVSAIMSQPFIDLHNKRVDEETRKTSAARTVAKIIAGTTTGVLVRWGSIKLIEKMTKVPQKNRKLHSWETFFSPDRAKVVYKSLRHYKQALGTILALVVMMFTNFAVDAPLTKFLTNKFIAKIKKNNNNKQTPATVNADSRTNSTNLIKNKVDAMRNISNNNQTGGAV